MAHVNVDTDRHRGSRRTLLWGHCRVGRSVRRDHRPTDVHDLLAMTRHVQHACEVEHTSTRRRPDPTSSQGSHMPHHHKKVKFSHTRYRPLGPELIPVYRQSCHRPGSRLPLLSARPVEEHPACKNWVMRCWRGYMSGARYRLFTCGPADATASHHLLPHLNPDWFTFLVPAYPGSRINVKCS